MMSSTTLGTTLHPKMSKLPPKTTKNLKQTTINKFTTHSKSTTHDTTPINTTAQLDQLKSDALKKSRFDKIQRLKRANASSNFQKELQNLEKTFLKPITPKKRTPRKTVQKNISYFEE